MNCTICGQAPVTRLIPYNGSAGKVAACNKKAHDLSQLERNRAKAVLMGLRQKQLRAQAGNPIADAPPMPTMGMVASSMFKGMAKLWNKARKG